MAVRAFRCLWMWLRTHSASLFVRKFCKAALHMSNIEANRREPTKRGMILRGHHSGENWRLLAKVKLLQSETVCESAGGRREVPAARVVLIWCCSCLGHARSLCDSWSIAALLPAAYAGKLLVSQRRQRSLQAISHRVYRTWVRNHTINRAIRHLSHGHPPSAFRHHLAIVGRLRTLRS